MHWFSLFLLHERMVTYHNWKTLGTTHKDNRVKINTNLAKKNNTNNGNCINYIFCGDKTPWQRQLREERAYLWLTVRGKEGRWSRGTRWEKTGVAAEPQIGSRESTLGKVRDFWNLQLASSGILPPPGPYLLILLKLPIIYRPNIQMSKSYGILSIQTIIVNNAVCHIIHPSIHSFTTHQPPFLLPVYSVSLFCFCCLIWHSKISVYLSLKRMHDHTQTSPLK